MLKKIWLALPNRAGEMGISRISQDNARKSQPYLVKVDVYEGKETHKYQPILSTIIIYKCLKILILDQWWLSDCKSTLRV